MILYKKESNFEKVRRDFMIIGIYINFKEQRNPIFEKIWIPLSQF